MLLADRPIQGSAQRFLPFLLLRSSTRCDLDRREIANVADSQHEKRFRTCELGRATQREVEVVSELASPSV